MAWRASRDARHCGLCVDSNVQVQLRGIAKCSDLAVGIEARENIQLCQQMTVVQAPGALVRAVGRHR